jgi:hypothetical protein
MCLRSRAATNPSQVVTLSMQESKVVRARDSMSACNGQESSKTLSHSRKHSVTLCENLAGNRC